MTTAAAVTIIKRTELANGGVLTTRRSVPHLIRPFQTFAVTPATRYADRLTDATCVSVAIHAHKRMVAQLMAEERNSENRSKRLRRWTFLVGNITRQDFRRFAPSPGEHSARVAVVEKEATAPEGPTRPGTSKVG